MVHARTTRRWATLSNAGLSPNIDQNNDRASLLALFEKWPAELPTRKLDCSAPRPVALSSH